MVGIYKGECDQLHCIEKFRCCRMQEGEQRFPFVVPLLPRTLASPIESEMAGVPSFCALVIYRAHAPTYGQVGHAQ